MFWFKKKSAPKKVEPIWYDEETKQVIRKTYEPTQKPIEQISVEITYLCGHTLTEIFDDGRGAILPERDDGKRYGNELVRVCPSCDSITHEGWELLRSKFEPAPQTVDVKAVWDQMKATTGWKENTPLIYPLAPKKKPRKKKSKKR